MFVVASGKRNRSLGKQSLVGSKRSRSHSKQTCASSPRAEPHLLRTVICLPSERIRLPRARLCFPIERLRLPGVVRSVASALQMVNGAVYCVNRALCEVNVALRVFSSGSAACTSHRALFTQRMAPFIITEYVQLVCKWPWSLNKHNLMYGKRSCSKGKQRPGAR